MSTAPTYARWPVYDPAELRPKVRASQSFYRDIFLLACKNYITQGLNDPSLKSLLPQHFVCSTAKQLNIKLEFLCKFQKEFEKI
jgi:hypothetical protein